MSARTRNLSSACPSFRLGDQDSHQPFPIYIDPTRHSLRDLPRFGPRYKCNATIATLDAPSSYPCGTRAVRIRTPRGLCDGRRRLRRCDGEARVADSARGSQAVGPVLAESKLAHEFWEDVVELLDPDILPALGELLNSCLSATVSENL
jgi:hypothetical protein